MQKAQGPLNKSKRSHTTGDEEKKRQIKHYLHQTTLKGRVKIWTTGTMFYTESGKHRWWGMAGVALSS